jgi:DNA invertase Pin-like site-specific DNA recombinase
MGSNKKVIELIRVSTESQAAVDRGGIPAQQAANHRTAIQYGLDIVQTIKLTDVSGAAVLRAPEIQELMRSIESPEIHGVVAREFSRLMRPENFADFALLQAFADTATILYLPEGPIDFASKSGRLFGTLRAAMAGLERTEILERVWAAKEAKRKAGKHSQSRITLPYGVGYEAKANRWYFTDEAEKVREAFRMFLIGVTSYVELGQKVGIKPFNLRNILRNPIYTGWRVYNQRRDPSSKGIRVSRDGRQADRRKIQRAPDEIIRVEVLEPLLSEKDFTRVQELMDIKKANHWRARTDYERRFIYSGFLKCGACGNLIYTHVHKPNDWYVCKSRTTTARRLRETKGLETCTNPYMRRERLEACIDSLLSERLMDKHFLERLVADFIERSASTSSAGELVRLQRAREQLQEKRKRILEAYFDNLIDRTERNQRLASVDADVKLYEEMLLRCQPETRTVSVQALAEALGPFYEWGFLSRSDKRQLLQTAVPEIHVANHRVTGLSLMAQQPHRDEVIRTGTDSWPPPA